jgi:hypothetical protein
MAIKKFDGKKVKELNISMGQLGKAEPYDFSDWLVFFVKEGLVELIEDAETDE